LLRFGFVSFVMEGDLYTRGTGRTDCAWRAFGLFRVYTIVFVDACKRGVYDILVIAKRPSREADALVPTVRFLQYS
jgi:hypothetical protein